jgi:hypothetical protein
VYVVVQLAVDELTVPSVHGVGLKAPLDGEDEKPTVPVGVLAVPEAVSVTVAVHVVGAVGVTVPGTQAIEVDVERVVTVTVAAVAVLAAWVLSALYAAPTVGLPIAVGVYAVVQLATDELTVVSVHGLGVAAPLADGVTVKLTVPVGVAFVPVEPVSVTVAVQVVGAPTATDVGAHTTPVVVVRPVTVSLAEPLLAVWLASPP